MQEASPGRALDALDWPRSFRVSVGDQAGEFIEMEGEQCLRAHDSARKKQKTSGSLGHVI